MALDGIFLNAIKSEIQQNVINARVEKISQPSKDEIIISLRYKNENGAGSKKLLISSNASNPRIHFTQIALENPKTPPMFCMLLRKHLNTSRLISIRQNGLDRVLIIEFEAVNELGDLTINTLYVEIMGRHSNIILVNSDGKIIDSIKRVSNDVSQVRMVLPGMTYQLPPTQEKLNLISDNINDIIQKFLHLPTQDIAKSIMQTVEGVSPLIAREIAYKALNGQEIEKQKLSQFYIDKIKLALIDLKQLLINNEFNPTVCIEETMKLRDFTIFDIQQYGTKPEKTHYKTVSLLLDSFYHERDRVSRMKQRSNDLLRLISNAMQRIEKKLSLQKQEMLTYVDRDKLKVYGDLINANIYKIEKGMNKIQVENFYSEQNETLTIKLDTRKTPAQNAQHYYSEYKKAQTAEVVLTDLMQKSQQELVYLDSVFDAITRTSGESELLEIRQELSEQGYIRAVLKKNKAIKAKPPLRFVSTDGFNILCGMNNKQNDTLTLKIADKNDLWLHTKGIAGSHVIIQANSNQITDNAITQAAIIAAYNSKARESAQVAVDYTKVRYVKKPNGAKPGMVIFTNNKTCYVTPDEKLIKDLQVK